MKGLRALFGLALVVGGIYVLYLVIPPYFNNYQFQDMIESEARLASYSSYHKNDQEIRDGIYKKAQDIGVEIAPEQIQVQHGAGNEIMISADYSVHVDLPLYAFDLNFHPSSKKK